VIDSACRKVVKEKKKQIGDENSEEEILKANNIENIDNSKQINENDIDALAVIQPATNKGEMKIIISTQEKDGSFMLSDIIRKETIIMAVKRFIKSEKLKEIDDPKLFDTAVTIAYLQTVLSVYRSQWEDKVEQAGKYIKEQINDEDLEDEILKASKKLIEFFYKDGIYNIETTSSKQTNENNIDDLAVIQPDTIIGRTEEKEKQIRDEKPEEEILGANKINENNTVDSAVIKPPKKTKIMENIISTQEKDGSCILIDAIRKKLDISSSETIPMAVKKFIKSEKLREIDNPKLFDTAVIIAYLQSILSVYRSRWEDCVEQAREYIKEQINDEDLEDEFLKASEKLVKYFYKDST